MTGLGPDAAGRVFKWVRNLKTNKPSKGSNVDKYALDAESNEMLSKTLCAMPCARGLLKMSANCLCQSALRADIRPSGTLEPAAVNLHCKQHTELCARDQDEMGRTRRKMWTRQVSILLPFAC